MVTKPLTLSGLVEPAAKAANDGILHELRREKQQLEEEILLVRRELDDAHALNEKLERSLRTLRKQLSPLHLALRAVFGEIELAVGQEDFAPVSASSNSPAPPSGFDPRWQSYKNNFPGAPAKIIDLLLEHPGLTLTQISKIAKMHYDTTKTAVRKLVEAGAVARVGNEVSLKR
jgi:hypothetical protein